MRTNTKFFGTTALASMERPKRRKRRNPPATTPLRSKSNNNKEVFHGTTNANTPRDSNGKRALALHRKSTRSFRQRSGPRQTLERLAADPGGAARRSGSRGGVEALAGLCSGRWTGGTLVLL